jgi:hypothetical protein
VFTARYALSPYIKQIRFVFKGLNTTVSHCFLFTQSLPLLPTHSRCRGYFHLITLRHTPQSVGLLWTKDQPDAETSTWRHKHSQETDIHAPRWDSNPRSQPALGRRPTLQTARPLGSAFLICALLMIRWTAKKITQHQALLTILFNVYRD